jgi:hypothetical protein
MALALNSFPKMTPYAKPRRFFNEVDFGFAIRAKVFFPRLHGAIAGNNRHGAKIDASAAVIAESGFQVKGGFHTAIFPPSHKDKGFDPQGSGTEANATPAQNAVAVMECIPDLPDPASLGNVLNRTGIGCFRNQQFRNVAAQSYDLFRIAPDDHAFLYAKGAGCGDFGVAIYNVFHNAKPAGTDILHIRHTAQVGNADAGIKGRIQHAGSFGGFNGHSVDIDIHILSH